MIYSTLQKFDEILCLFLLYYNWALILRLLVVDNIFYGSGFVLNVFKLLNIVNVSVNDDAFIYVVQNSNTTNSSDIIIWHARLGNIGQDRLHKLARAGLLGSLTKERLPVDEYCFARKATRLPFDKAKSVSSPLQLIHSDIYGPINVRAKHEGNYFIVFIDDFI